MGGKGMGGTLSFGFDTAGISDVVTRFLSNCSGLKRKGIISRILEFLFSSLFAGITPEWCVYLVKTLAGIGKIMPFYEEILVFKSF
jgi:hypothetical protein